MPTIKGYQQRVSPEGQVGGQATGSDFGGPGLHQVGQAVQSATSDTAQAIAIIQHNKARNEATDADLKLTLFGLGRDADLQQRMQNYKLGDPDFTADALQAFSDGTKKLRYNESTGEENFETSLGQRTFAAKEAHMAKLYANQLGQVQAKLQGNNAVESFNQLTAAHSNSVAIGENYLNVKPVLQEYEQSIRTGVFNTMPADKREELLRQGKGVIANSAVDGYIRSNPRGAQKALQGGFLGDILTKDQTSALLDKAQTGVNMADAEKRRAEEAVVHATKLASESQAAQVGNAYLSARADPHYNPYDTQRKIFKLMGQKEMDNLTGPQIMAMVGALDSDIKDTKSRQKEGNSDLSRRLFTGIWKGEITDLTAINEARSGERPDPTRPGKTITFDPISASQHKELIEEFNDYRTPDGKSLLKEKAAFVAHVGPQILHPGPFGIYEDATTGDQMQRYVSDLTARMAQYRKEGKNPYDLLDPKKPDYFGSLEIVNKYQNTSFGSLAKPTAPQGGGPVIGDTNQYGLRTDGTPKGSGFFGELKRPDGKVSTELSTSDPIDVSGKAVLHPLIVPTLTRTELDYLLSGKKGDAQLETTIYAKAAAYARKRIHEGKSPFADGGEQEAPPRKSLEEIFGVVKK